MHYEININAIIPTGSLLNSATLHLAGNPESYHHLTPDALPLSPQHTSISYLSQHTFAHLVSTHCIAL